MMDRRTFLSVLAAATALPARGSAGTKGMTLADVATPFDRDILAERARILATLPYKRRAQVPDAWLNLTYDEYRKLWFDTRNALWRDTDRPQRVDVFHAGLYFPQAVHLNVVEDGQARRINYDFDLFDKTDKFPDIPLDDSLGYSGFRLRTELEKKGIFQEYAVFQGASYLRGHGVGEIYGLSARGLALKTADPMGEEFPDFTDFWLEAPQPGSDTQVVHALLDSPSVTGAYRFEIRPGDVLEMQVSAQIFARTELTHLGLAPLTSMFLFDDTMRQRFSDFRPAVHDSDGVLIHNGAGEVIWRPLANPTRLQISAFGDNNPRGFGLMQRKRKYSDFNDLEALYHKRPGVWITPGEAWGAGSVTLVEIPANLEIYDNIVAYWRPATPIKAGQSHQFSYAMHWGAQPTPETADMPVKVLNTAMGGRPEGGEVIVIDFADSADVPEDLGEVEILLRASAGTLTSGILQRNPETNGPRLAFTFKPGDASLAEFRAQLRLKGAPLSEVWLYRWTKA